MEFIPEVAMSRLRELQHSYLPIGRPGIRREPPCRSLWFAVRGLSVSEFMKHLLSLDSQTPGSEMLSAPPTRKGCPSPTLILRSYPTLLQTLPCQTSNDPWSAVRKVSTG